jgi:hypothetical protein
LAVLPENIPKRVSFKADILGKARNEEEFPPESGLQVIASTGVQEYCYYDDDWGITIMCVNHSFLGNKGHVLSQRSNSVADLPVCGPNFYPFSVVSC